jgi:5-formyltetrahydrofolate cyclo-ligase
MKKSDLRATCLAKQKALSPADRAVRSDRIAEAFFRRFDLCPIRVVHIFIPIEKFNEVDTRLIIERLWTDHPEIQTVAPVVDFATNEIKSATFSADSRLIRNAWDIDEPANSDFVESERIDVVLVPGLCFDRRRHRVGYGKGFYGRFLKDTSPDCIAVGLSYFEPVDDIDDVYEGDTKLDLVITPDDV